MIQAPPPPTSCPCAPVGCRAISLVVCPQPLFHRSAHHCLHMRTVNTQLFPYSLSLPLFLSPQHTRARTPPLCSDVSYLIKEGRYENLLKATLPVKPHSVACLMKC